MESIQNYAKWRRFGKDISHHLNKLDDIFIKNGGEFREVKIGDIFNFYTGDTDIQNKHINGLGEYVITSGLSNSGILGQTNVKAKIFEQNTITVDMFGNAFFRDFNYKVVTHARVFVMDLKKDLNIVMTNKVGVYLVSLLKYLTKIYKYDDMCSPVKIKNNTIILPYINNQIAVSYMEEKISELEQERIHELEQERAYEIEAYLMAVGLTNCQINQIIGGGEWINLYLSDNIKFKEFKIGDLFKVQNNPQLNKDHFNFSHNAKYPYFTRTINNNGILGYVEYLNDDYKILGNSIAVGMMGMQFFYMANDFYAGQFTKTIYAIFNQFNESLALYFISLFNKYSDIYKSVLVRDFEITFKNSKIYIPVDANDNPDFMFMEQFIKDIERTVIQDIVLYKDKIIDVTRKYIEENK